jgi:hypothetical protein
MITFHPVDGFALSRLHSLAAAAFRPCASRAPLISAYQMNYPEAATILTPTCLIGSAGLS